jgi:hypothetical protein
MHHAHLFQNLVDAGVPEAAGLSAAELGRLAADLPDAPDAVLAVHPALVPARRLAPLLRHRGQPGFVVDDLTDLEAFTPITDLDLPDRPLYLLHGLDRGDDLRSWSPDEALPELTARGRTPLTVSEGISWLLQQPEVLEPNHCFMTVASRKSRGARLDARTPAIWISGGTGRDGRSRRGAPKVGWCWAGNRHTWLGFASARERSPLTASIDGSTPALRSEPSPTTR